MANQRGETTSIGHFYNRCIDAVNNLFDTMSFWTHSKDVEFVDGKTAETKVGAINGITSDMSGEADDIAASIKCVNQLNNSLNELTDNGTLTQITFNGTDFYATGKVEGADAVTKKLGSAYDLVKNTSYRIMTGSVNSETNTIPTLNMNIYFENIRHHADNTIVVTVNVFGIKNENTTYLGTYGIGGNIPCKDYDSIQFTFSGTGYYVVYHYVESID